MAGLKLHRCFWTQPSLESGLDRGSSYSTDARPLCDGVRNAVDNKAYVGPTVVRLIQSVSPSAVLARVGPVVVDAIQRVSTCWSRPNVGQKVLEGLPSRINGDPATPVIGVSPRLGVSASLPNVAPRTPLRSFRPAVAKVPVRRATCCRRFDVLPCGFPTQTPTAPRSPAHQGRPSNLASRATVASAHPLRSVLGLFACASTFYSQPSESYACDVHNVRLPQTH
jgi:hypothetical protein